MKAIKYFFPVVLLVISLMTGFSQKSIRKNFWNAADVDTIFRLSNPTPGGGACNITDDIYKAINPRFIANKYGILTEERNTSTFSDKKRIVIKSFSLFIYDQVFPMENSDVSPIRGGHEKWNYYINDNRFFSTDAARAIISAIMLQAIDRIDFTPPGPKLNMPPGLHESAYINPGVIRFNTRDISKSIINENATVYIVDDNKVITKKIYEAINPVFIRSLRRITNPEELANYGYKEKMEIVKIELFEISDLTKVVILFTNDCPKCDVILVDNIQIDWKFYQVINKFHIKEIYEIREDEKEAFAPYRKFFPKKKLKGMKYVTIVSL